SRRCSPSAIACRVRCWRG
ncbi:hypothetical protein BN1723_017124, partial [Verticillium longisporum]